LLDLRSTPVSGEFCGGFLSFFLSFFLVIVTSLLWPVRKTILPSCPLRARVLVQRRRDQQKRRSLLRRAYHRNIDSRLVAIRCDDASRRPPRTRGLEVDVHHQRDHHPPGRSPRTLQLAGNPRQSQVLLPLERRSPTSTHLTKARRPRPHLRPERVQSRRNLPQLEILPPDPPGRLLLEQQLQLLGKRLHPLAQKPRRVQHRTLENDLSTTNLTTPSEYSTCCLSVSEPISSSVVQAR
jgi:hypothetical protein